MRRLLFPVVCLFWLGCSGTPSPNYELVRTCIADRAAALANEWAQFESASRQRVVSPDWRTLVRRWAWVECNRGRPVPEFHPVDTATARRHY